MAMNNELIESGVLFLGAAVVAVPLAQRLGLGSVLGYLLAGVVIGPWGLSLISDVDAILHFSELGVVLLLFLIGLELNPKKLWAMRMPILGLGGAQVIVTTLFLSMVAYLLGQSWMSSLAIGMGLALSSTAIALRVIDEQGLAGSETGQSGFAVLLFQDIAVIPMLALLPLLAGEVAGNWADVGLKLSAVVALLVAGHFLLRPLFRFVLSTGTRELFTAAALLVVFGIAVFMQHLGLSMALGTFLAGVLLAESEYRHELEITIEPFKGLLLGLFFISVGMSVNLGLLIENPLLILATVVGLVTAKGLILYVLARLFGTKSKSRSRMAAILSQGGEFAFVIFTAALGFGLLSVPVASFLLVVVSLSMVTTPLILKVQTWVYSRSINTPEETESHEQVQDRRPRVIVAGFGRFGQVVGRLMYANKVKITILESDASQIKLLRKFGYKVYYGEATNIDLLRAAGAHNAEAIVLCTDDPDEIIQTIELCQQHFPHLKILARARSRVEAYQLLNHGVTSYSRETFLGALDLGRQLLIALGMHPHQASRAEKHFNKLDNTMLKELLPQHSDESNLALRAKEARKELEEIFDREIENERQSSNYWNKKDED
ncbi:glutathione-regulated potassium-efflux system protein KefB [Vibrio breoganii]|uniref:Glutathione-regulated potassium-efflux system protein KefB n=3 Tax=Vibrio TaxID=662 RepID=A0AAP8MYZ5_9VIBR|nr:MULTISPECIES: glutathione-regulated potassium-efflux system protein KefB [Vibrio]ANO31902.1 glutathione-regulated potassium-efflux system protein KefB [Vibrio breoganii]NMO75308.1 glutathione-regulated potassium-efflux system protein KefB [Vibrio breoganii]NMR71851.1 glutathione-regulated potassium-efflux system protein KefB [Vibrio breoganii]OED94849.1 glutathione-regulated potassium-efflux system protein KefB [Vibrio breoganii ZF-29]PMG80584.1 glutathione-regulated potassium-efflux system